VTEQTEPAEDRAIVAPDGRPARRAKSENCPRCGAGPERRTNTAGFGEPVICCSSCGWEFKGATE
jgi:uncharacterized protein (DUF983 family)